MGSDLKCKTFSLSNWMETKTLFIYCILGENITCLCTMLSTHESNSLGTGLHHVACLTADSEVAGLIPAQSHTLVEIDDEIISMVILLLLLIQEGLLSVTSESICIKYWLTT